MKVHGEVLTGWYLVESGTAFVGDKFWDAGRRAWMPVLSSNSYLYSDVKEEHVPAVIRR
jgi:hypothetical protein